MILGLDGLVIAFIYWPIGIMYIRFGFCSFLIIRDLLIKELLRYFGFI